MRFSFARNPAVEAQLAPGAAVDLSDRATQQDLLRAGDLRLVDHPRREHLGNLHDALASGRIDGSGTVSVNGTTIDPSDNPDQRGDWLGFRCARPAD